MIVFRDHLDQRSPTFLAPGTGFVEDNFSTNGVAGWGAGDGLGHNVSDGGSQVKLSSLAPCSPPAVQPVNINCPRPRGWGPLTQIIQVNLLISRSLI